MALTQLGKSRWQEYFEHVSRALGAKLAEVEVTGLGLGAQVEAEWLPLVGISYDPSDDVLMVMLEGMEHPIRQPKQIHVEQDVESLWSIQAVDADGLHHILLLKDPLKLPHA